MGTLFLLMLLVLAMPATQARQRDTLGVGERTYFVENRGQWNERVCLQAQMHNAALFAECNSITIALRQPVVLAKHRHHEASPRMHAYRMTFVGSSDVRPTGADIDVTGGYDNYYLSADPRQWATKLPHYSNVYYRELYPGIDMQISAAEHAVKYYFLVSPQGDPSQIVMRYEGQDGLSVRDGNLVIRTSVGDIVDLKPYVYQLADEGEREILSSYKVHGKEVRIELGNYDKTRPLVIDPVLHFSTYTGSTADNWGTTASFDSYKNAYTAGLVFGIGYPVSLGAYDMTNNGNADIGIFKFDTTGTQRLYATYLGGSNADMPHSMYVNALDELVIFGTTGSADFPVTEGAYEVRFSGGTPLQYEGSSTINFPNGSDIFVSRFSSDGTALMASTYVGGSSNDGLNYRPYYNNMPGGVFICMSGNDSLYFNYGDGARGELITDDLNNVYVGSTTFSYDFPVTGGCVQRINRGRQEGVAFKLDYNLRNLIWSTYLGGSGDDAIYSIDVDSSYNLLVCGGTNSHNFLTTAGAFQTTYGGGNADGFVSKISKNGDRLMSSTFFGSQAYDQIYFVRSGRHDEVFVFGQTKASGSTMVYNARYNTPNSGMLLARFSSDLTRRIWSTVFGTGNGRPNLSPTAFAADICNRIYAAGWGRDFVGYNGVGWQTLGTWGMETTPDAYQSDTDGQDFYIMSLSADASQLEYATFFGEQHGTESTGGADHVDGGTSRFDKLATLYQSVCASCGSTNAFPTTPGAWSDSNQSINCNNALFRFNVHDDFPVADFAAPPVGCAPYTVSFHNQGRGASYHWDFGDGATSTETNPTHTFVAAGTYRVRLIASLPTGCRVSDTAYATVHILNNQGRRINAQLSCDGESVQIGLAPMAGCDYTWIRGEVSDSSVANPYVSSDGEYVLLISSADGACRERDTFSVQFISLLDSIAVTPPTCPGGSNGRAVALNHAHLSDSAFFVWDGDTLAVPFLTGLSGDGSRHTLVVEDHGCRVERTFGVNDPPLLQISKQADQMLCGDSCTGSIRLEYGYEGFPVGDTLVENLCEGSYVVRVSDTAGCPYYDTTEVVRDRQLEGMDVWADDTLIFLDETTTLHATVLSGATYHWTPESTLDNPLSHSPKATPEDTLSLYDVVVTDDAGCSWNGSVAIHCTEVVCGRPNIFIPNVFSPTAAYPNDKLRFRGHFVVEFYFALFSRWGEKVFETSDINASWDGRYRGNLCLPGVYTYTCKITCEAGKSTQLKGDITLVR